MDSRVLSAVGLAMLAMVAGCSFTTPPRYALNQHQSQSVEPVSALPRDSSIQISDLAAPTTEASLEANAVAALPSEPSVPFSEERGPSSELVPVRLAKYGSCDCPYDLKSNGASCGAGSAWSKPGGKSPQCYATDPSQPAFTAPSCAENGTCYGDISNINGMPKTVHVGGYYRKDGTYVRGHYRSKGRR